eukprot:TRINITY_DN14421_c0_g2_i1.p1 TRINITY_DN14421_c0_g2~~TRINITY_DN14421_c0_g2_i1.p1  ORF type:complete len:340 (+),score=126.64 TRINITY_DN14421_c0_g2_i1:38-1057(+)
MSVTGKRMRCVLEANEDEELIDKADGLFSLVLAVKRVQERLADNRFPKDMKQMLFNEVVKKAEELFCEDIILEMLIMIDQYHLNMREKSLSYPVYRYLSKVVNVPTPDGTRSLLRKLIEGKRCRYDTPFMQGQGGVWNKPVSWAKLTLTLQHEVARNIHWIDSKCSNVDLQRAVRSIKACFLEPRDDHGSGDEVSLTESITVDLNCPLSTTRIVIPARAKATNVIQPFDLEHFLTVSLERNRTQQQEGKDPVPWKCPVTGKPLALDTIIIDPYFTDILSKVDPSVRYVTIHKDGTWTAVPPATTKTEHEVHYIEVPDTPFDPSYDVRVKEEPVGQAGSE